MPKAILQIANGFYMSDSLPISAQECTNFYPNKITAVPALSTETLFGTAGSTQLATSGIILQQNRGSHTMAGIAYFVNGKLFDAGTVLKNTLDSVSVTDVPSKNEPSARQAEYNVEITIANGLRFSDGSLESISVGPVGSERLSKCVSSFDYMSVLDTPRRKPWGNPTAYAKECTKFLGKLVQPVSQTDVKLHLLQKGE